MKAIFSGISLAIVLSATAAKKAPLKFGDVAMEEMLMTSYDKDSAAIALILGDYGESTIIKDHNSLFSFQFERVTRIKIFSKEAFDLANYTIRLNKRGAIHEKLTAVKGVTYNLKDGRIVATKVKNNSIFEGSFDADCDFVKVAFPDVREGSVIEISYKVSSDFLFNLPRWEFQSALPTVISEYRVRIPEYFSYRKYTQGNFPIEVSDVTMVEKSISTTSFERQGKNVVRSTVNTNNVSFMEATHSWVARDVPAFKPEPFMAFTRNLVSSINFELQYVKYPDQTIQYYNEGSWEGLNRSLIGNERFGAEITGNAFLKTIADDITSDAVSPEEKIAAICNYVKLTVTWDGIRAKYSRSPLQLVLEKKKGNSAEINLLLTAMLQKAGIAASPVLLSTRDNGPVLKTIPVASQFNYVICLARVEGKSYLLDATDDLLPLGLLPEYCLNGVGFVVAKEGFQWISLYSEFKSQTVTSADFSLSETGVLGGKLTLDCSGYAARNKRTKYQALGESGYVKDFVGSRPWTLIASEIRNAEEIQNNLVEVYNVKVNENIVSGGEILYFDPFIGQSLKHNPFPSERREYPVDFGSPGKETFFLKLTLPANYTVEELPANNSIIMPGNTAKYTYSVSFKQGYITITSIFQINKSLFSKDEYPYLREFYTQVIAKQAEPIVLRRK